MGSRSYTSAQMAPATPAEPANKRLAAALLLEAEIARLGRPGLPHLITFSDSDWRSEMENVGCPAYLARLASPTARRGTRGKLGMATICHLRHEHPAVVYIRVHGRSWPEIQETVRHEALHVARPSYSHRQVDAQLHRQVEAQLHPKRHRR
jgi:hypothetical protein